MRWSGSVGLIVVLILGSFTLAGCGAGSSSPSPGETITVTYCNGQTAKITEPSQQRGAAPAAIYLHGGSWVGGDYNSGGFIIDQIGPALWPHTPIFLESMCNDFAFARRYRTAHLASSICAGQRLCGPSR